MPKIQDLAGQKFGRLTAVSISHRIGARTYWNCDCICGKKTVVAIAKLKNGWTTSCGCYMRERQIEANSTHGLTAGGKKPAEFICWNGMKTRCLNPRSRSYKDYGGRGITVCERWLGEMGLKNFIDDMGPRPGPEYSIGRQNNNGNYEPGNCKWETDLEQGRNTRRTRYLTYNGKTQCMSAWCEELGLADSGIHVRLKNGWSLERALSTPVSLKGRRKRGNPATGDGKETGVKDPRDWLAD